MTHDHTRSSAEIEREVERTREQVSHTLDELRLRMSPGQLIDQALDYAKDSGGAEFGRNLGRSVRDNPLPILLIGAGVGWLMASGRRPEHYAASDYDRTAYESEAGAGRDSRVASMAGKAGSAAAGASHKAGSALHGVGHASASAGRRARELSHDARDGVTRAGSQAWSGLNHMAEEQPLMLGAIGLAVGAAIGAALPSTRTEDRFMGRGSDAVKDRAMDKAGEKLGEAAETAEDTYHQVTDDMKKRGYSKESAGEALGEAARTVKTNVTGKKDREDRDQDLPPSSPPSTAAPDKTTPRPTTGA
ncbi:DUF3618 domain-containing protein [Inquilinus sp. CAU 1745]|uniref:DUF3618 domain-containing protein n=1 Tax=Inquilinus sp. CAU 1745 TaxID=3140369 RepID=UPI00325B6D3A